MIRHKEYKRILLVPSLYYNISWPLSHIQPYPAHASENKRKFLIVAFRICSFVLLSCFTINISTRPSLDCLLHRVTDNLRNLILMSRRIGDKLAECTWTQAKAICSWCVGKSLIWLNAVRYKRSGTQCCPTISNSYGGEGGGGLRKTSVQAHVP